MAGDPPNYSTPLTLALGALCVLAAFAHFTVGALDYGNYRYLGLGNMSLGGLLLVYGVLTIIRFAEARDALSDPLPRTPMYDTPHQHTTLWIGVGLNLLGALTCAAWALAGERPALHLGVAALNVLTAFMAWHNRARAFEFH